MSALPNRPKQANTLSGGCDAREAAGVGAP